MRIVLVKVILFCGITFVSSILLAAPYWAGPATDERVAGFYGCRLDSDADVALGRLARAAVAQGELGEPARSRIDTALARGAFEGRAPHAYPDLNKADNFE